MHQTLRNLSLTWSSCLLSFLVATILVWSRPYGGHREDGDLLLGGDDTIIQNSDYWDNNDFTLQHRHQRQDQPIRNRSILSQRILDQILNKTKVIQSNTASTTTSLSYIPPCDFATNVLESTSSLLVATALVKAHNVTRQNENYDIWEYFNSLFSVPSSPSGFIPRYAYPIMSDDAPPSTNSDTTARSGPNWYIPNTRIPNWPLFSINHHNHNNNTENSSTTTPCRKNETQCWVGSGRISAIPFHATVLLELILKLEDQEYIGEDEFLSLTNYWDLIFNYHAYLHDTVMRGCNNQSSTLCYNILHPWESLIMDSSSPLFQEVLEPTIARMQPLNWTIPFPVPPQVENFYDYNETIYSAMIFLAECMANQTTSTNPGSTDGHNYPYEYQSDAASHEEQILKNCQFAMLDIGYAFALMQADDDLYKAALWLTSQQQMITFQLVSSGSSSWSSKLARFKLWRKQNLHVLNLLWDRQAETFTSRYASLAANATTKTSLPVVMAYSKVPVSNNLMVFWKDWNSDTSSSQRYHDHLQEMNLQLLRHKGKHSFDCQSNPLWSNGCDYQASSIVDPRLNYFVGLGLSRNKEIMPAYGAFLTNATIDLVCGAWSNTSKTNTDTYSKVSLDCANNLTVFQEVYAPTISKSLTLDQCGKSSIATASLLYHLLLDDFDFTSDTPIPPIGNPWVITLVTLELMIAFAVGVSCVVLSLNIIRTSGNNNDSQIIPFSNTDNGTDSSDHNLYMSLQREGNTRGETGSGDENYQDIR